MTVDYLPTWATLAEASQWLEARTGQPWPLPRLIEVGLRPHVWLTPDPTDAPNEAVMTKLFDGRHEGFVAPLCFAGDTHRLAIDRRGTLSMTFGPSGDLFRFTPGIPFEVDDLRFKAEEVRRAAGGEPTKAGPASALHSTLGGSARADLLTPVIEDAVREAGEGAPRVFALLQAWAREKAPRSPLIGVTNSGVQWLDAEDEQRELTVKNLRDRLRNRKQRPRAKTR